jgi:hypothetical protein
MRAIRRWPATSSARRIINPHTNKLQIANAVNLREVATMRFTLFVTSLPLVNISIEGIKN